jgi:pimeloyl-ACP methyl ester carboxylesterase
MKTQQYILSAILSILVLFQIHAQVDQCSDTPVSFDPEVIMRDYEPPVLSDYPAPTGPTSERKRKIYWLHGLGGEGGSWASGNAYTLLNWSKNVQTDLMEYTNAQFGDLKVAAAAVYSMMDTGIKNDPELQEELRNDFIVAHSLGGLVARRTEQMFLNDSETVKPYGGIVTFGTPHLGSGLADFKVNKTNELDHFINLTCKSLLEGPSVELIYKFGLSRFINRFFIWSDKYTWLSHGACDLLSKVSLPILENFFTAPIDNSLVPDNPDIQEIANIPGPQSELHTVAFWGEEFDNDDMAFRFLFSASKNIHQYGLMQADIMDDDALQDAANFRNVYQGMYLQYLDKARNWPSKGPWKKIGPIKVPKYTQGELYEFAYRWQSGVKWIDVLNPRWKYMIGTTVSASDGSKECFCDCRYEDKNYASNGFAFDILHSVDCGLPMACGIYEMDKNYNVKCEYIENEVIKYYETTSDGVVTRESAVAFPNAKYQPIRMVGSGHMQMRNDSELKKSLDLLYYGVVSDYFKL